MLSLGYSQYFYTIFGLRIMKCDKPCILPQMNSMQKIVAIVIQRLFLYATLGIDNLPMSMSKIKSISNLQNTILYA